MKMKEVNGHKQTGGKECGEPFHPSVTRKKKHNFNALHGVNDIDTIKADTEMLTKRQPRGALPLVK